MVEVLEAGRVPGCREALRKLTLSDLARALQEVLKPEKLEEKKGELRLTYVWRPDEFTKKRLKAKARIVEEPGERLVYRVTGGLDMEIVARCIRDDEAVVAVAAHGKTEKMLEEKTLRWIARKLLERMASTAPPAAPAPPPPAAAPTPTPVAAPAAPAAAQRDCIERLVTAGLPVDEELSRRIKEYIHAEASVSGRLVDEGTGPQEEIDLSKYSDGYDVRIIEGYNFVESVRWRGRVGVYYRNEAGRIEAFGEEAVRHARGTVCRRGVRVTYLVLRLETI